MDNFNLKKFIIERRLFEDKFANTTRSIVRDIINTYKQDGEGDYELPTDIRDDIEGYDIPEIGEYTVELSIEESDNVDTFLLDAGLYQDESIIQVSIVYNENAGDSMIYDLVGALNETIRHEIEHIAQYNRGEKVPTKIPKKRVKYYLQPHELGAQLAGFKRIAKLKKQPIEKVIKDWFISNKNIFKIPDFSI